MKKLLAKLCMLMVVVIISVSLGVFPIANAEPTAAQNQAMEFIENVLPVDLSKYNITFLHESTLELGSRKIDNLRYLLDSKESTFEVDFSIQNNVVLSCHVTEKNGSVISDKKYLNLIDAVTSFLETYQTYTKIDSTNLIDMLGKVDVTKNSSITVGDTKLTISNTHWNGEDLTDFRWTYYANGLDYTSLGLGFRKDGILDSVYDNRAIYTIGDTSIKVSSEQAIDIATKNLSMYAYMMPDKTVVSDFNITENKTTAKLVSSFGNSTEIKPYWNVKLYLNQTDPGSVHGFTVFISAASGEIVKYGNIAYGGAEYDDGSDVEYTTPSDTNDSILDVNSSSLDPVLAGGIAATLIGLVTVSVILVKKRKK
ncbi:MAG: hypothetical protein WC325_08695 [Candidatus Bathyarchaeia archaeon]